MEKVRVMLLALRMVDVTGCPKTFTGVEEHCGLVAGRSKLSKSDEK